MYSLNLVVRSNQFANFLNQLLACTYNIMSFGSHQFSSSSDHYESSVVKKMACFEQYVFV